MPGQPALIQMIVAEKYNIRETFDKIADQIIAYLNDPVIWIDLFWAVVKIMLIFIAGRIIVRISTKAIFHFFIAKENHPLKFDPRRTKSIGRLVSNIISYTVNFIIVLMILKQMNVELAPLLAGAGIVGLAIGFGAQNLVRDVISGFFIIFEDQFAIGDVIQTGNFKGTVEEIGLRVTKIKSWTGEIHILPNGTITQVTNFSMYNSIGVIDVAIAYQADIGKSLQIIKETANKLFENHKDMVKEPEVLGIQTLNTTEVIIRVTFECRANAQHTVARALNEQIKLSLDASGVAIRTSTPAT